MVPRPVRGAFALLSSLSPSVAAHVLSWLFMHPPNRKEPRPEVTRALEKAHRTVLDLGPRRVTAWRWGSGPRRALLVHGWGGRGSQLLPFVGPLREAGFEVWMIDAPAHGESEGPALVLPEKAALLRAAGERLGGIHAIVAHSFGAAAAALASREEAVAMRLALIAPPGDMLFFTRAFASALGFSARAHDLMIARFERRYGVKFESFRADAVEMAQPSPTLIVHDRSDESVPFDHSELLHSAWSGARLLRTEGLGHKGVLSDPDVVAEVVRFVSG